MKLSVAMCTYNGAKYIAQQLDSMLSQTLPLDEIVICDDGSTDGTHQIVREYQDRYPDVIHLHINDKNMGVCANFDKALHLCTGDIIFLADQDDIWYKDKTLAICRYFERHKNKSAIFTNADLIDSDNHKYEQWPRTLFESFGFNFWAKRLFNLGYEIELIVIHYRTTGATMAIRKHFLKEVRIDHSANLQNLRPLHDALIGIAAMDGHRLGYLSSSLIMYRCHPEQQTGANFKYRIHNSIIIPYYSEDDKLKNNAFISQHLLKHFRFLFSRITDKGEPTLVLRKIPQYIHYYRWLCVIVFGIDFSKAVYRKIRAGIVTER